MIISKFGIYAATNVDEWSSILELAAKWKFKSIKDLAIEKLAVLASPIDRIVLGRKHHIAEWLVDAYQEVCERPSALTLEEATRLGMEDVVKISFLRQGLRNPFNNKVCASVDVVSTTFGLYKSAQETSHVESVHKHEEVIPTLNELSPTMEGWSPTPASSTFVAGPAASSFLESTSVERYLDESPFSFKTISAKDAGEISSENEEGEIVRDPPKSSQRLGVQKRLRGKNVRR